MNKLLNDSLSKNSNYGASVSVAVSPAGVELKNISVNGAKGKGKGSWTSAQTSVIAKNGGETVNPNINRDENKA